MGRSQTEIVGFGKNTYEGLEKVSDALDEAGMNSEEILEILARQIELTAELNARQEELKRELKATTKAVIANNKKLYLMASGYLDAAMGAVGKSSDEAKNLRQIRSRIRKPAEQANVDGGPAPGSQA